jgi:hypothetical protein
MLLSFERPGRETPAATLLAVLENCRCEADARAIDKQLVRQFGYHRAHSPAAVRGRRGEGAITVKILRAHGGCLGT